MIDLGFGPGWSDYACNTQGMMTPFQLMQRQSADDADNFIELFEKACANGLSVTDSNVQEQIFSTGVLGGYDALLEGDKRRVTRAVEKMARTNTYY